MKRQLRLLSEDDNSEIVSCGPGEEEPLGELATVDMFTPRVGAIATESKEQGGTHQGRSRTPVMWGRGIRHPLAASTQQAIDSSPTINVTHAMVIRKRDPESGPAALPDMTSRLLIAVEMGLNTPSALTQSVMRSQGCNKSDAIFRKNVTWCYVDKRNCTTSTISIRYTEV